MIGAPSNSSISSLALLLGSASRRHPRCLLHSPSLRRCLGASQGGFIRSPSRSYSPGQTITEPPPSIKQSSNFRRFLGFFAIAIGSFSLGIATNPDVLRMHSQLVSIPSDEESNSLFQPSDEISREINDYINTHPLALSLRSNPAFTESRPHMKYPAELRKHSLTGGTLAGADKIVVPPYAWSEEDGKSFVSMFYLGMDLSGHPGIVHGGLLATLLDEGLARCCFPALPNRVGVTANLNIDYRRPAPAGSFFVLRAKTTKVEGRKAWVEGWIETLPETGKDPEIVVEAKALFVEPKNASLLPRLYRVN